MRRMLPILTLGLVIGMPCLHAPAAAQPPSGPPVESFLAFLSGSEEVPPVTTPARGLAAFQLRGDSIHYVLIVARIENVVASHIHMAPVGTNGPVVVNLLNGSLMAGGGPFNGLLATGTITANDLTGPLAGMTLADLANAMRAGDTYVNVHTNDGVAPPNTGPGDFPGGEVRGQIQLRN